MKKFHDRIVISITDVIKNSAIGRAQPILNLPYFHQRPIICPAAALESYLSSTTTIRPSNEDRLILTTKKPYRAASSQTLGRWIKQTLQESGIDTSLFSAHSTRHASTSAAFRAGISVDVIRKTAGWSDQSAVFANFYNRPIIDTTPNLLSL
ncbi:jg25651 [Pararge aegeria aegeria]|uniref:Jg25651 protein n=1 Tax=Pararge aegeria aegeria TaxID=348720 RepID=A0A8S4QRZ8_9NEOP|nr:jg25651 [Pararge aegeria aegeria]